MIMIPNGDGQRPPKGWKMIILFFTLLILMVQELASMTQLTESNLRKFSIVIITALISTNIVMLIITSPRCFLWEIERELKIFLAHVIIAAGNEFLMLLAGTKGEEQLTTLFCILTGLGLAAAIILFVFTVHTLKVERLRRERERRQRENNDSVHGGGSGHGRNGSGHSEGGSGHGRGGSGHGRGGSSRARSSTNTSATNYSSANTSFIDDLPIV